MIIGINAGHTIRNISALKPAAQTACNLFLERCKAAGLDVLITETYRTQERQNELYAQGRTAPGKKVTWTKNSRHTSGRAWDICKNKKGAEYADTSFFKKCGAIAAELGITWGGTWSTPDMPHFEIPENWKPPERDEAMTEAERKKFNELVKIVEDMKSREGMIYNYIDSNMPEFAKPTIKKLCEKSLLQGDKNGLNLSYDMLRILVILDRTGLFD